jgi:hypothetical protein
MDDKSCDAYADPAWANRPSLHEMQLQGALEFGYQVAAHRDRQRDTMHSIVTRAIAAMVPVNEVSNRELARILFGELEQDNKRSVRHIRNDERPLKSSTAGAHIQRLLQSKKIAPSEGGRLWYVVLLHATGIDVVAECFRLNGFIEQPTFEQNLAEMTAAARARFDFNLGTLLNQSSKFPLAGYALNDARQFMDYCAFIHWQESKVKRNPLVSIQRLLDLSPVFDEYTFDE